MTTAQAKKHLTEAIKATGLKAFKVSIQGHKANVIITDPTKEQRKEIESIANGYQYGEFDGMQDMYVYSGKKEDFAVFKYVFVEDTYSPERLQKAREFAALHLGVKTDQEAHDYDYRGSFNYWNLDGLARAICRGTQGMSGSTQNYFTAYLEKGER